MVSHRQLLGALFAAAALSAAAAPMPENSGMVCDSMIVNGWGVKPVLGDTQFILERDAGDFTILPNLIADNSRGKSAAEYTIDATLTDINGRVFARQESKLAVPAGGRSKADPFEGTRQRLNNQVALFTAEIADAAGRTTRISGIFGEAAPVGPEKADVFGMNVHFGRYDADQRWKLYPLLKKAGVSTVRTDSSFRNFKTREEARETLLRLKEAILGQEAFGFESMVLVGYFPPGFHRSAEKLVTAREWMELLARELKGRASFHYGRSGRRRIWRSSITRWRSARRRATRGRGAVHSASPRAISPISTGFWERGRATGSTRSACILTAARRRRRSPSCSPPAE